MGQITGTKTTFGKPIGAFGGLMAIVGNPTGVIDETIGVVGEQKTIFGDRIAGCAPTLPTSRCAGLAAKRPDR